MESRFATLDVHQTYPLYGFAVIIMVVWVILNIELCTAIRIFLNFKKPPSFKRFVLIMGRIKSIEWFGIDSGMLKLIEINYEPFFGVITQCL